MKTQERSAQTIIIGAGAAGLACARELKKAGREVLILEARDHLGGRAWTFRDGTLFAERGAEFIHGAGPTLTGLMEELQEPFVDACDRHLFLEGHRLREIRDFWGQIEKLSSKLDPKRRQDRSVEEFLRAQKKAPSKLKSLYKAFIEGFQAADTKIMGEKGLAIAEGEDEKELNGSALFRPAHGYSAIMEGLFRHSGLRREDLKLLHRVWRIRWSTEGVEIECESGEAQEKLFTAENVVITIPVGVWQADDPRSQLKIEPEIPDLQIALSGLAMGHVQRLAFHFQSRFWESLDDKPVGFLHAGVETDFPTWWTQAPLRTPMLIAWQGGPRAEEMSRWPRADRIDRALETLSRLTRRSKKFLREQTIEVISHNWSQDPFAFGAYSYAKIEGDKKARRLQRSFEGRIFVAGEATAKGPDRGTVHGALESGIRAAREILKGSR